MLIGGYFFVIFRYIKSSMELLIGILVGAIAGWLAGKIMRLQSGGLLLYIILGIVGAFVGNWLFNALDLTVKSTFLGSLVTATIGAIILIVAGRILFRKR